MSNERNNGWDWATTSMELFGVAALILALCFGVPHCAKGCAEARNIIQQEKP